MPHFGGHGGADKPKSMFSHEFFKVFGSVVGAACVLFGGFGALLGGFPEPAQTDAPRDTLFNRVCGGIGLVSWKIPGT